MKFGIKLITSMCTARNYTRQSWKLSWFSAWKISWNLEYAMEFNLELAMDFGLELKLKFEFMREMLSPILFYRSILHECQRKYFLVWV